MAVKEKMYPVFKILALLLLAGDLVSKLVFKLNFDPVIELTGVLLVLVFLWVLKSANDGSAKTEFVQIEMGERIKLNSGLEIIYEKLTGEEATISLEKMGKKNGSYPLSTSNQLIKIIIGLEKIFWGVFDEKKMPQGIYVKPHTANKEYAILELKSI